MVAVELFAIAWVRKRFLRSLDALLAAGRTVGGAIVLAIGVGDRLVLSVAESVRETRWYTGFSLRFES